jgi:hypothetical protein
MGISVIARKARGPLMAITQLDRKTINHTASQHLSLSIRSGGKKK